MNLLMLSGDSSPAQGQQSAFFALLKHFAAYWDRIDVLCPRAPGAAACTIHGHVHLHPSPWGKPRQSWYIVKQGRRLYAERPYDLIVSHDFGLFYNGIGAYVLARRVGVPVVSELHHVEGYPRAATRRERIYRWLAMWYIRWAQHHVAAFRVVNRVEMPALLRRLGVPDDKILVLGSLYLDFDVFYPRPDEVKQYDVLFVGRLAPNKGLFTILDALIRVQADYPAVTLGIRGDGPLQAALESRIAYLRLREQVKFIPRVSDQEQLARLYAQARMVVCASTAEGGPRVTAEAMACGVPVITTPVGIMPELADGGANALVFEWDAGALARHISALLGDAVLCAALGDRGRAAVQEYEAGAMIARYAEGYHDLIRRWKEKKPDARIDDGAVGR